MAKPRRNRTRTKNFARNERLVSPGPYWPLPVYRRSLRFSTTSAITQQSVTAFDVLASLGIVATGTTTATAIAVSMKLHAVHMWFCATTAGTPVTGVVNWSPDGNASNPAGPECEITETTISTANLAHFVTRPMAGTVASFWQTTTSTTTGNELFYYTVPIGAVMQLDVSWVQNNGQAAASFTGLTVATGQTYYRALPGGSNMVPVGVKSA